jgi:hypothetical protein
VKIAYTIEDGKIKIKNFDLSDSPKGFIRVYNNCLPVISFFHMKGSIQNKTYSFFDAVPGKGIILSVQIISQNSSFGFQSCNNTSINFAPVIKSVQLILTNIPFGHSYEDPGVINRFDVFIAAEKISTLIPQTLLDQLHKQKVLNLSAATNSSSPAVSNSLNRVLKKLEKPTSKSLCTDIENFIQSVTI